MVVAERKDTSEADVGEADCDDFCSAPEDVVPSPAFSCPAEGDEKGIAEHEYADCDDNECRGKDC